MLRIENLHLSLAGKPILQAIDLHIPTGVCVGILGPNGSGKTTLLKCLAYELQPQQGQIDLAGRPLRSYSARERARTVGVLMQELDSSLPITVEELVLMGRYPYQRWYPWYQATDYHRADEVIKRCHLNHLRKHSFSQLSGGEKQRALWAKLLMQDPDLFLLDEPINHLDIRYQMQLLQELRQLCKQGKTVLIVLHDLNLAAQCCEQLVLMHAGRLIAQGSPHDVLQPSLIQQTFGVQPILIDHPHLSAPQLLWSTEEEK